MARGVPTPKEDIDEMLGLYMKGYEVSEIEKKTGMKRRTIYNLLKSDYCIKELESLRCYVKNQVKNELVKDGMTYIDKLKEIASKSTDVRSSLKATETLLAYLLGSPRSESHVTVEDINNDNIDSDRLNELKKKYNLSNNSISDNDVEDEEE
ncbi:hypothetical protein [Inediibacterium massiliense]|uniref:hypothetical protein n=1 Tax=Inediibacterium massiliense TaxID=1658111 RepID=UPI0006B62ED8|nr:hypothetical protein [Inediibacterium massiliense]